MASPMSLSPVVTDENRLTYSPDPTPQVHYLFIWAAAILAPMSPWIWQPTLLSSLAVTTLISGPGILAWLVA